MKTRKQILDFLVKQVPNRYLTLNVEDRIGTTGIHATIVRVYIADYTEFESRCFTPEFKTIKELGNYIQEHFKNKI